MPSARAPRIATELGTLGLLNCPLSMSSRPVLSLRSGADALPLGRLPCVGGALPSKGLHRYRQTGAGVSQPRGLQRPAHQVLQLQQGHLRPQEEVTLASTCNSINDLFRAQIRSLHAHQEDYWMRNSPGRQTVGQVPSFQIEFLWVHFGYCQQSRR